MYEKQMQVDPYTGEIFTREFAEDGRLVIKWSGELVDDDIY